jgi:hypothetical protein
MDWIDAAGFKADVMKIVGTLMRKHKFYHIRAFTKSNEGNVYVLTSCPKENIPLNPQILIATSGTANTGIEDPEVYGIYAEWISRLASWMSSKKWDAGRRPHANSDSDWYVLYISLDSFDVLLRHLYDSPGSREASYLKAQEANMFVIPRWCQQASLEKKMANPYISESAHPAACLDSCTFCSGGYRTLFPKLVKSGAICFASFCCRPVEHEIEADVGK